MSSTKSAPLLAMAALHDDRIPSVDAFVTALQDRVSGRFKIANAEADSETGATITLQIGDEIAAISLMPAPIPWEDLEGPCATAWWWPSASMEMKRHSYHLIIAMMGGGTESSLERAVRLTHLVSAAVQTYNACGVFWSAGTLVHEPEKWLEDSEGMTADADKLQPHLWIDMRVEPIAGGGHCFFTTGLKEFGCLEIEVPKCSWKANELHELAYGVTHYVLGRGSSIPAGETIGRTSQEKIAVKHGESMFPGRGQVMRLMTP
ncbi:MAG: DUF4261 domain-containing protein [bacterium]|nr:DUF4261 domain-containing protein [bacterium]